MDCHFQTVIHGTSVHCASTGSNTGVSVASIPRLPRVRDLLFSFVLRHLPGRLCCSDARVRCLRRPVASLSFHLSFLELTACRCHHRLQRPAAACDVYPQQGGYGCVVSCCVRFFFMNVYYCSVKKIFFNPCVACFSSS